MNKLVSKRWICFVVALLVLIILQSSAMACPTCKDGIAGDQNDNMKEGYFWSIVFMMSMPFVIFAALAGYFYFMIRRARKNPPLDAAAKPEVDYAASEASAYADEVLDEEPVEV